MTRTVQMTLDSELVREVDKVSRRLKTSRSAFTRDALQRALGRIKELELEQAHREGYRRYPARKNEFGGWHREHAWGDE